MSKKSITGGTHRSHRYGASDAPLAWATGQPRVPDNSCPARRENVPAAQDRTTGSRAEGKATHKTDATVWKSLEVGPSDVLVLVDLQNGFVDETTRRASDFAVQLLSEKSH